MAGKMCVHRSFINDIVSKCCIFAPSFIITNMATLPIRPPKLNPSILKGSFWKQIGMIVIATTISLLFTILAAQFLENRHRAKDRRLSAMMVMSNIEIFSRNLEEISAYMAPTDSVATWLLSKPIEELELLPETELDALMSQATDLLFLTYDKSAENIFSNNVETWKNVGNMKFIDRVGKCFSAMNTVEEYWNKRVNDVNQTILDIKDHPRNYEGSNLPIKILRTEKVRRTLAGIHYLRTYLTYVAATMRYHNQHNMEAIGITEQELMDYTNLREQGMENPNEAPDFSDFYSGPISFDSLVTFRELDMYLDSLKGL